jgi:hypothetical protein
MSAHLRNQTCIIISQIPRGAKVATCGKIAKSIKECPMYLVILFNLIVNEQLESPLRGQGWLIPAFTGGRSSAHSVHRSTRNGIRGGRPSERLYCPGAPSVIWIVIAASHPIWVRPEEAEASQ